MKRAINAGGLCGWILGNFRTVDEVKKAIREVRVWASVVPELNVAPPVHFAVHDAEGNNIVIEFIKGEVNIYDNPIGVMTNAPTFDWHLTNLRNYVNLTSQNAGPLTVKDTTLTPTGNGSGMLGVPGDWTPPSRFVRAVMFVHFADPVKSALDGVGLAAHILNTVDIPHGTIAEKGNDSPLVDYTQWVEIKDLTNRVLYVRDYKDLSLRAIDLKRLDFAPGAKTKSIPLESDGYGIREITDLFL
jgi:choloylglycine hydrolase